MQFSFHPKRGNFFNNNKTFTSESDKDLSKDDELFETHLNKNASIPEPANLMSKKTQGNAGGLRKKSILKNYKNSEQNSVDEGYPKHNTYFLDKGGAHLDVASELSEIEKVASIMNRTDEFIVKEENSQAEHTPQGRPTRIPNFGLLSKFSPEKQQQAQANQSLDISSPISQGYPEHDARQDTEDGKGIIGNIMKITDKGKLFPPPGLSLDIAKTKSSSDRNQLTETPLFKTEKNKQTTESNSAHLASLTGVNEEKSSTVQNQNINLNNVNREDGRKGSYAEGTLDSHATRKLNDSNISRKHHKKATLFAAEARNGHIIPGYTRYVLDENVNQQQVYMPHFSDKEISEAFATLDINKDGYITADEINYFLEVLEENANEAEIEEMVRMLDYEGTGRVRYEEFYKMATGKNLNPIGQAYPPTLDLFEKKRNADLVRKMRMEAQSEIMGRESSKNQSGRGYFGNRSDMDTRYYGKIDSKLNKLPRLGNLGDEGVKYKKTDKDETDSYFKGFIRQAGLNMKLYMEKYDIVQFSPEQRVAKVPYKDFLGFFVIDDQDVTKKIFSILGNDRNNIDMRQVMIALSMYLEFTSDEKISLAYDLFDPEGHGYILYNELMKTFQIFQLGEDSKKIEKKIKAILNRRSIMPEDSIPKEEFMIICKNFPDLFAV